MTTIKPVMKDHPQHWQPLFSSHAAIHTSLDSADLLIRKRQSLFLHPLSHTKFCTSLHSGPCCSVVNAHALLSLISYNVYMNQCALQMEESGIVC